MDSWGGLPGRGRKQLVSAARAVRNRRRPSSDRAADPALIALVEEPYRDVAEAERRLADLLAAFEARDDRRAVFLSIYSRMTSEIARRVRRDAYADPDWVGDYLVAFANLYREAVRDYERGDLESLARPWQLTFETAERGDALLVQDALLGVNAHINYDLALAVEAVGVAPNREQKYADHSRISTAIAAVVDDAQDALVDYGADGIEPLDEALGRLDERLSVLTIDECRDSAWRTAVAMHSRFGVRRRAAGWLNHVAATGAAHVLLSSRTSDLVHERLVELEGSTADL